MAACLVGSAAVTGASAQTSVSADLEALRQIILEQRRQVQTQNEILAHQQRRLEALERQINALSKPRVQSAVYPARPAYPQSKSPPRAVGRAAGQRRAPQAAQAQPPGESPAQKRPGTDVLTEAISERAGAGVFGKAGQFIIEPAIQYTHNRLSRVSIQGFTVIPAITIGNIDVREIERNTLTASLTGRYNATKRLQFDVKVPYVKRKDTTTTRPLGVGANADIQLEVDGSDIGDVTAGIHYQVTDGTGDLPILVLNARVKSRTGKDPFEIKLFSGGPSDGLEAELPTGSGFWSVEPSITAIIPSDPVVFFGNVGYQMNLSRDITSPNVNGGVTTNIDPGDAFKFSMGFGFGINEKASFSLGYDHAFVFTSTQGGTDIFDSDVQVGTFSAGVAYKLSSKVNLNLTVGIGVTDTAPDAELLLRIPIKLN